MEAILKAVRKSTAMKHQKLSENVAESREVIRQGVSFRLKYLGSTLVEELDDDSQSYGNGLGAMAVKSTVTMAKASGKKSPEVIISISDKGIHIRSADSDNLLMTVSIYRINFCTADKNYEKVFAFIARNTDNETMECHAFLCNSHKVAETVALTVAQSFSVAKEDDDSPGTTSSRESGILNNLIAPANDSDGSEPMSHNRSPRLPESMQRNFCSTSKNANSSAYKNLKN